MKLWVLWSTCYALATHWPWKYEVMQFIVNENRFKFWKKYFRKFLWKIFSENENKNFKYVFKKFSKCSKIILKHVYWKFNNIWKIEYFLEQQNSIISIMNFVLLPWVEALFNNRWMSANIHKLLQVSILTIMYVYIHTCMYIYKISLPILLHHCQSFHISVDATTAQLIVDWANQLRLLVATHVYHLTV